MRIDTHGHFSPPEYSRLLEIGAGGDSEFAGANAHRLDALQNLDAPVRYLRGRLEEMEAASIELMVLSLPPPGVNFGNREQRVEAAQMANDELIAAAEEHWGKFLVVANLPFPHTDESLEELDRVATHPLIRGVSVFAVGAEWTPEEERLEPVFKKAAELGLPAILHPFHQPLPSEWKAWKIARAFGPIVSSTVCASRILLSGMLDRIPDLDVIMPHLGGSLLYVLGRYEDVAGQGDAELPLIEYLRTRFYFDTCSFHIPAVHCAVETVGADRLIMGTDSPFRGSPQRMIDHLEEAVPDADDRRMIMGETARRWFDAPALTKGAK